MVAELGWAGEAGKPRKDVLAGANRQRGKGVLGVFSLQAR